MWFVALGSRSRPLHRATRTQPKRPSVASSWEICVPALGKLIRGSTWQTDIKHTADTRQDRGRHTAGTGQDDGRFTAAMVGSLVAPCSSKQHVKSATSACFLFGVLFAPVSNLVILFMSCWFRIEALGVRVPQQCVLSYTIRC